MAKKMHAQNERMKYDANETSKEKKNEITATSFTSINKYLLAFLYRTDLLMYKLFLSSTFFCTLLFHYFHNLRIDYYHYLNAYNEILFNAVCLQMLTVTTINERKRKDMPFAVVDEEVMSRLLL